MTKLLNRIKTSLSLPIIVVVLLLFASYPYVFNCFLPLPSLVTLCGLCMAFSFFYLANRKNIKVYGHDEIAIWTTQIVFWVFLSIYHSDTSYITRVVLLIVTILLLNCVYLKDQSFIPLIKVLNYIIFFQAILAAIGFFLVLLGVLQPFFYFENVDMRQGECYLFTCTNAHIVNFIRVAGYFDEPGAFAFWGIFSLIFNKLFVDNKKIEVGLMVCLFFTFSLAYIFELALYLLFLGRGNFKRVGICVIIVVLSAIFIANFDNSSKEMLDRLVFERVDSNLNDENERNAMAERARKHFVSKPIFGKGAKRLEEIEYIGDNPYEILAKDGVVGYLITYLPLIVAFFKGSRKERFASIILFVDYQQRPFHINPIHFLYINLFILLIVWQQRQIKKKQKYQSLQSPLMTGMV